MKRMVGMLMSAMVTNSLKEKHMPRGYYKRSKQKQPKQKVETTMPPLVVTETTEDDLFTEVVEARKKYIQILKKYFKTL